MTKREKARRKAAKELELHKKEQALKHRADAAPETASEFEKALMANPKSSFLWIRYAAFHLSSNQDSESVKSFATESSVSSTNSLSAHSMIVSEYS